MKKISSLLDIGPVREYLARVGAEPRSLRTAVVRDTKSNGYWTDVAVIRFNKDGSVSCNTLEHAPTEAEQQAITAEWAKAEFPAPKRISRIVDPPEMIRNADPKDLFLFKSVGGREILMVQVRLNITRPDGTPDKRYVPWTYWDDDQWRACEPDGDLPLFGLDQLPHHRTVFIHEGAKAAAYCRWLAEGKTREAREAAARHPWGRELMGAAHLGWIGGALNPVRTDWSVLAKNGIERAYIVADNDDAGRGAIAAISRQLRMVTLSVEFNDRFPPKFDLADPFPEEMFKVIEGRQFYVGPTMRTLTMPATWATDVVPNPSGTGRPLTVLREHFKKMWVYVEEADVFVCSEMPEIVRPEGIFNKMVAGFSHVWETSRLLVRAYKGRSAKLCYRPDQPGLKVDFAGTSAINLHVPSEIKPIAGDPRPWLEFLEYMFVNKEEREEVMRWCATLIARPDIRMGYGLLLVSETQGIGKTTLGAHVLAPLVGQWNVGYPAEKDILSDFNDWVANKRLAIINEIYSGSSWRAYNALKSVITDQAVTVNQKYMRQYVVDNWCHIVACSYSLRALKMEHDDRRWFYPEVSEFPWPGEKFVKFRQWIDSGGLSVIRHWAEEYGKYVAPNERAPMTKQKAELIAGSQSEAQEEAAALARLLADLSVPAALLMRDVVGWVRNSAQGRVFDTDVELRRAMVSAGCFSHKSRIKAHGRLQYAIMNRALAEEVEKLDEAAASARIIGAVIRPQSLMEDGM